MKGERREAQPSTRILETEDDCRAQIKDTLLLNDEGVTDVEPDIARGWGFVVIGSILIVTGFIFVKLNALLTLHAFIFWALGPSLISKGYRLQQNRSITVLLEDKRLPVLYLRPFNADQERGGLIPFLRPRTDERRLIKTFARIGPVIAVGNPGERLPSLGAYRIWFENGIWRSKVVELMRSAQLVIIRVGISHSLFMGITHCYSGGATKAVSVGASSADESRSTHSSPVAS